MIPYYTAGVLGLMAIMYFQKKNADMIYVKAYDGNEYLVRNLPDAQQAANTIAQLRKRLVDLANHLYETRMYKDSVVRLKKNFNPNNLSESEHDSEHTSYSINKGERVVLCIRSKDGSNRIEDLNTLTFVAIHELAHIMTLSVGHTDEFWDNFRYLLKKAIRIGLYRQQDFHKEPVKYCGTSITDTPLRVDTKQEEELTS